MTYIGKNIIENLTTGMYENSKIIYREYIQNSADGIDKALAAGILKPKDASIYIKIEPQNRKISIEDNGYGIPKADFKKIMESIADSQKTVDDNKGFRGIGRLGGISVCDELRFITSAAGESVESVCIWDAKLIKAILVDQNNRVDAATLVNQAIAYEERPCAENEHYFKVELLSIDKSSEELLNSTDVTDYISTIAPIPYRTGFCYGGYIKKFANDNGFSIDEYRVFINEKQIFKPYVSDLYEPSGKIKKKYDSINDVKFEVFKDNNDKPIAWMWYGISNFEKQIPKINKMRGLRLRKGNIQIGNDATLYAHGLFKEERGNYYFIGEIFAVSPLLIPNARRDYFNLNDECRLFESRIRSLTYDRFYKIYCDASKIKNDMKKIQKYHEENMVFNQNLAEGKFIDENSKNKDAEKLEEKKKKAEKAKKELQKIREKYTSDEVINNTFSYLEKKFLSNTSKSENVVDDNNSNNGEQKNKYKKKQSYLTQGLTKYTKKEQKLVSRIYNTIQAILPPDQAKSLIEKIQEDLMQ